MSENWRKAGWAGAAIGVIAAGAAAGVAVERITVGRGMRRKARLALDATGDYGSLRGTAGACYAEDGTEIYYEVDEPSETPKKRPWLRRKEPAAPTVVFCHGYCLGQDSWHFQRAALRGMVRAVYWDQRSHGRSARGFSQADGERVTIDQLGRDLKAVIDAAAPEGPLILVGHSMGGMTIMALAEQFPELIRDRVIGVALVGTSSGHLDQVTYGLPSVGMGAVRRILPPVLKALGSQVELVEKGRRATADLFAGMIKMYSFGAPARWTPVSRVSPSGSSRPPRSTWSPSSTRPSRSTTRAPPSSGSPTSPSPSSPATATWSPRPRTARPSRTPCRPRSSSSWSPPGT